MSTNPTQRHTARPSRSRVMRAVVGAWIDRHADALALVVVATIVTLVSALVALGLVADYDVSTRDAIAIGLIVVLMGALSGAFSYVIGNDRASRRVSRVMSRAMRQNDAQHDEQLARVMRDGIGHARISDMSAYDMSAELARLSEREYQLRYAMRYAREDGLATSRAIR